MAEMIVVKCDIGSRAATVLCPSCARISRQILKEAFNNGCNNELLTAHTCPVCGTVYHVCNSFCADVWRAAYSRYTLNPDSYNEAVKDNHNCKKQAAIDAERAMKSEPVTAPKMEILSESVSETKPVTETETESEQKAEEPKPNAENSSEQDYMKIMEEASSDTDDDSDEDISIDSEEEEEIIEKAPVSGSDNSQTEENVSPQTLLERKMDRWKKELLDTSKRNKMINYRESKRQTLKILEPGPTELFNQLAVSEKTLTFQRPISKDSDFRTYSMLALLETLSYSLPVHVGDIKAEGTVMEREKTLKNLRAKTRLAQEEQGTNILYLSFGFILWREHNRDSSPWLKSPLLMMPVQLGIKSLNAPYTLSKYDDEIEVNPTLDYLFNQDYGIDLPTFELKNKDSFENYLEQIEEIIDKKGWKLVREVSLGLLSFLKISMYHDLNNNREQMMNTPVIQAISGDRHALGELPSQANNFNFDKTQPTEWHEVVDSDSSQEEAILLSKLGVSFVMQGPPGTGKSQTITNIIAEALGDGKKVLFVSEKSAALQVVLKRLTDARLDDFCLSLHNYKANKKEIIDNIGANLSLSQGYADNTTMGELTELFHDRQYLDEYAEDLHKTIEPFGESVYMVFGRLAKLSDATVVEYKIQSPTKITKEEYASLLFLVDAFEKALNSIDGELTANPWANTTATASGQIFKAEMMNATDGLARNLGELEGLVVSFNQNYGCELVPTWNDVQESIGKYEAAIALPLFPIEWRDRNRRSMLRSRAISEDGKDNDARTHAATVRELFDKINAGWTVYDLKLTDENLKLIAVEKRYEEEAEGGKALSECNTETIAFLRATQEKTELIIKDYREAVALIGLSEGDSFSDIVTVIRILKAMENAPVMDADWFDVQKNPEYIEAAEEAKKHQEAYTQKKAQLLQNWEKSALDINVGEMIVRFKTKYTTDFYRTKESIDKDLNRLRIMHKSVGVDIEDTEIIDMLQALVDINTEEKWFEANDSRIRSIVPGMYREVDTDWDNVLITMQNLSNEATGHQNRIKQLTGQVLTAWEPGALNIDSSSMLNRFKTEHVGMFRKMKTAYKDDMKQVKLLSKSVGTQIEESQVIELLQTLNEIRQEKQWFFENAEKYKAQIPSYYRAEETDWDRVNREVGAIADEARVHQRVIREKTAKILERWEASVLDTEPVEILRRFREEYTESYRVTNDLYKKDILYLMSLSKRVGEKVSSDVAIELLRVVNGVNIEKKWYENNNERLATTFKANYEGLDTDWDKVITGIRVATDVASQIPGTEIPNETIQAILKIIESPDRMTELHRLSDDLTESRVEDCERDVQKALSMAEMPEHSSLHKTVITGLNKTRNYEEQLGEYLCILDSAMKGGKVSWNDLKEMINVLDTLASEKQWFISNTAQFGKEQGTDGQISTLLDFAAAILKRYAGETTFVLSDELKTMFGNRYTGLGTDWQGIVRDIDAVSAFEEGGVPDGVAGLIEAVSNDSEKKLQAEASLRRIHEILNASERGLDYFDELFPSLKMRDIPFHEVADKYNACMNGFGELNKWLDFVETRKECDAKGLEDFTDKIVRRNNAVKDVRKAFERGFYKQWLGLAIDDVPSVQTFRRRVHEQRLSKFKELDERQFELSKDRIRDRIIRSFPNRYWVTSAKSELGILQHEMNKKRKIMPLRKLFQEIPTLLLTLKPCLMMSPLSVAYFLNAEDYHFDMVIFDEASQIFPQDAIGAIFRADQAIIAGDTRQLPPTNFFSTSTSNGNDNYDDEDEDEIYDSILEETANVLPNRTLLWHYRSKHEHLIAFSNQEIYKNELVTFPSSNEREPDTGVEFYFVEGGYYDRGAKRNNILEAKRCVELVADHIEKHSDRSLGIIAFSEAQQQTILNEIQKFKEEHPKYEEFFGEDREEAFFVKNLENVQGDERDTIILSICYARTKDQIANNKPMAMNFGPVMKAGGERRLNVAITRAKINVKLVSSILPSDIDLSRTTSDGIKMIRSYIEFAMNGGATLASAQQSRVPDDFANAIYKFICDKGYKARQYVGCSGYRIDIAVEHPEMEDEFVAGIECDGVSYAAAKTARDRDRLRGSVLKNMGWNLYRVWSTEWYRNPEVEGNKLIEFIDKAIAYNNKRLKSIQEQKEEEDRKRQGEADQERAAKEREERGYQLEEQRIAETEKANAGSVIGGQGWSASGSSGNAHQMTLEEMLKDKKSKGGLYDDLVAAGFTCIDNRSSSAIIWVLYKPELKEKFEEIAGKYHAQYKLEKRGAMATGGRAAWRIMT